MCFLFSKVWGIGVRQHGWDVGGVSPKKKKEKGNGWSSESGWRLAGHR